MHECEWQPRPENIHTFYLKNKTCHYSFRFLLQNLCMINVELVVCQYIPEVPSKPLPMDKLPSFLKLTKNSRIGFEAEYNVGFFVFV